MSFINCVCAFSVNSSEPIVIQLQMIVPHIEFISSLWCPHSRFPFPRRFRYSPHIKLFAILLRHGTLYSYSHCIVAQKRYSKTCETLPQKITSLHLNWFFVTTILAVYVPLERLCSDLWMREVLLNSDCSLAAVVVISSSSSYIQHAHA